MSLEVCRICGNNQNLLHILDKGPEMLEKLSKCASIIIKSDDLLPKLICQQCDRTLDMSYLLRKQSEAMQHRLQHELLKKQSINQQKREVVAEEDVQYISEDEEFVKEDCIIQKGENGSAFKLNKVVGEKFAMDTGMMAEEFVSVEHDVLDTHSESTLVASETEEIADVGGEYDYHRPNSTSYANAAVSNDSFDISGSTFPSTSAALVDDNASDYDYSRIKTDIHYNATDEAIDVGDNDERSNQEFLHSDSSSNLLRPQECLSIDMISNCDSPTLDNDTDYNPRPGTLPFTCITCHEVFARKKDYKDHIAQHGPNRYQCIQCLAAFPTRYRLIRHEATHNDGSAYKCSECNRQYRMAYNLQRHILSCHSDKAKFQCHVCRLNYTRSDVLKRHINQVHGNSKKWHCKYCGMSFRSLHFLNEHKSQVCTKLKPPNPVPVAPPNIPPEYIILCADKKYKCVFCNMKFKTISNCKTHLLIHNNIKPFPCSVCPKSFRTRYALVNHERIHNNERPFECDICLKAFRQVTHLKHHRMLHTKDEMVKCPECQAGFVTKWKLREHLRREHYTMKAFKCAECPEEFFLKYDLKRHAKIVHLRSVSTADSDNEGVKKSTHIPDVTSDSERSQHVDQSHDYEEEHYNDIDGDYDTDVPQAQPGDNIGVSDGYPVQSLDQVHDDVIDIAEDTDHAADDDDDVHIIEDDDNVDISKDPEQALYTQPPSLHVNTDTSSSHMFVLNDVEDTPLPPSTHNANDNANEPQVICNESIMDCIHLDSSNSCKSSSPPSPAPATSDNEFFDNIIEQEEEIHITEEKIERFTRYYNVEDTAQT